MLQHHREPPTQLPRVVILGAGGFLAPVLRRNLELHGASVSALGRASIDLTSPDAGFQLEARLNPSDVLVMAAGLTPDRGKNAATLMANLRMAEAVSRAVEQVRPAHLIYISSDAVYDARFSSLLTEESTTEPVDLYSLMHVGRERILAQSSQQAGVPFLIVRPCAIYGPDGYPQQLRAQPLPPFRAERRKDNSVRQRRRAEASRVGGRRSGADPHVH